MEKVKVSYIVDLRFQKGILDVPSRQQECKHKSHELQFARQFEFFG
jgi:hypothetical protein